MRMVSFLNKTVSRRLDTKNICSLGVEISGFMQADGEVIAIVFPDFQSSESWTSFERTIFTGGIQSKTDLLSLNVGHCFTR